MEGHWVLNPKWQSCSSFTEQMAIWCHIVEYATRSTLPLLCSWKSFSWVHSTHPFLRMGGPVCVAPLLKLLVLWLPALVTPQGTKLAFVGFPNPARALRNIPLAGLSLHFQVCRCHLFPAGTQSYISGVRGKHSLCSLSTEPMLLISATLYTKCSPMARFKTNHHSIPRPALQRDPSPNTKLAIVGP